MPSEGDKITAHVSDAPDIKVDLREWFKSDCSLS